MPNSLCTFKFTQITWVCCRCVHHSLLFSEWCYIMFYLWHNCHRWQQAAVIKSMCSCVCVWVYVCACFWIILGWHVWKMKVRVELMVVKGPSVYLVLFNMKYKPLSVPHSPLRPCYCQRVSVVRSPLKARFPCSSRGGSLGNLITRLKALSIRQITRSVQACVCVACACVFSGHTWSVCMHVFAAAAHWAPPLSAQWAGRNSHFRSIKRVFQVPSCIHTKQKSSRFRHLGQHQYPEQF